MRIYCIIPARKHSKSIKDKNIMNYKGIPLFLHSINHAKNSNYITKTFLTSDSSEYLDFIKNEGVIPIKRPSEYACDTSNDIEFMTHFIEYLTKTNDKCDLIVHLRPTTPERSIDVINNAICCFINHYNEYDSLRSVTKNEKCIFKTYTVDNNILVPLFSKINDIKEPYNVGRQQLPITYIHNGYIDIMKPSTIIKMKSMTGLKILPYIINESVIDIDTYDDLKSLNL